MTEMSLLIELVVEDVTVTPLRSCNMLVMIYCLILESDSSIYYHVTTPNNRSSLGRGRVIQGSELIASNFKRPQFVHVIRSIVIEIALARETLILLYSLQWDYCGQSYGVCLVKKVSHVIT